ncbi:NCS2 family permease [Leptospira levettii]|uniref:NCS2 family permease n=1 Tax=Leptospira levettii TaxID=2023178 RepID=A0ABY2MSM9_9LEPT|nr:NCS2 family permease [Leptospira levettii]MCW7498150.1 NCS2 family permease [Leptospira levettii]TGL74559.1 NCS2 family permease [Leptospira levettii]TGM26317.1 NCS2 family permease [Leptospira levettii]TGM89293.1 NCS2 family permease [Leptospira levettii]
MNFFTITRGDLDGFFGLMVDNLIQLLVLSALCMGVCGFPLPFITSVVLPGAAISLLIGNVFYAWQAWKLGQRTNRTDVTAIPYGINTVSLFAFIFFVMFPTYQATGDFKEAWKAGLLVSFASGLIEVLGSFVAAKIRKYTPRAALLSALAGIALTFISMDFLLRTFERPMIAFIPLGIILLQYFGKVRFPFGIPGGFLSILVGVLLSYLSGFWGDPIYKDGGIQNGLETLGFYFPQLSLTSLFETLTYSNLQAYFSIILPMGIFNVIGSLQNIESAEASGDSFDTKTSLLVNGVGTLAGTAFGSPFPTTIYIGHPGWKALGAKHSYSMLSGVFMTIVSLFGLMGLIQALIPVEAGMAIVLWIGIIITSQAFQAIPKHHSPAVVVGLLPAFAGWAVLIIQNVFLFLDGKLQGILQELGAKQTYHFSLSDIPPHLPFLPYALSGILSLSQGFLITSMIWAAMVVFILEREWLKASVWAVIAACLSMFGWIHAYELKGNAIFNRFTEIANWDFPIAYISLATLFLLIQFLGSKEKGENLEH